MARQRFVEVRRALLVCWVFALSMTLDRAQALLAESRSRESIRDILFPEQRRAVEDPHDRICLWTTGRAGKSFAVLTDFVATADEHRNSVFFFFCLSEYQVEEIAWPTLQWLDKRFKLGCRFQEQKLRVTLPHTNSWIRLFSFNRLEHLDRYYGIKLKGAAMDEAAFAKVSVDEFVEDTIGPRLIDQGGKFYLMSIPPRTPRGLFYDIIKDFPERRNMSGVRAPKRRDWSVHSWTWRDNPAVRDKVRAFIKKKEKERPGFKKTAHYLRNYEGQRVNDRGERVYVYDKVKNEFWRCDPDTGRLTNTWSKSPGDIYILGVDFGYEPDMTAFSLNVYRKESPILVEIESYKAPRMVMQEIADRVRMYIDWCGSDNITVVADHGAKGYVMELIKRYNLPLMISEKYEKNDHIEVLNDDLKAGLVKVCTWADSPHVDEAATLTWKQSSFTQKRVEQPGAPNDCCDAHLAAHRHAYHFMWEQEECPPDKGSLEWYKRQEQKMVEALEAEEEDERNWYDV